MCTVLAHLKDSSSFISVPVNIQLPKWTKGFGTVQVVVKEDPETTGVVRALRVSTKASRLSATLKERKEPVKDCPTLIGKILGIAYPLFEPTVLR